MALSLDVASSTDENRAKQVGEVSLQDSRLLCDVVRRLLSGGGEKWDGVLNCLAVTSQHVLLSAAQQIDTNSRYERGRLTVRRRDMEGNVNGTHKTTNHNQDFTWHE